MSPVNSHVVCFASIPDVPSNTCSTSTPWKKDEEVDEIKVSTPWKKDEEVDEIKNQHTMEEG